MELQPQQRRPRIHAGHLKAYAITLRIVLKLLLRCSFGNFRFD